MKIDDGTLKRLFQERTRRARRSDCPTSETFRTAATGELGREERERLADHLGRCSDCAREYRIVVRLRSWAEESSGRVAGPAAPSPELAVDRPGASRWKLVGVAATIVVAVALVALWNTRIGELPDGGGPRGITSIAAAVEPPAGAVLDAAPERLAWNRETGATYRVELYDFRSRPVWQSLPGEASSVELPPSVREGLGRGQVYYWRVFIDRGIDREHSPLYHFEIAP